MNAVLNMNNVPVRVGIFSSFLLGDNGLLTSFEIGGEEYEYFSTNKFLKRHIYHVISIDSTPTNLTKPGYYKSSDFHQYLNGVKDLVWLKKQMYKEWDFAEQGDIIEYKPLRPGLPADPYYHFEDYYRRINYKFKFNPSLQSVFKRIEDLPEEDSDPLSPTYSVIELDHKNYATRFTGLFYAKNFGDHVSGWNIPPESAANNEVNFSYRYGEKGNPTKYDMAYIMTLLCWKMYYINKNVLGFIAIESLENIKTYYINWILKIEQNVTLSASNDAKANLYPTLSLVDKSIAELMRSWGLLTAEDSRITFDPIFDTVVPNKFQIENYYKSLLNFYNFLYFRNESAVFPSTGITPTEDSDRRMKYIVKVIPESAIATLPHSVRIKWLDYFMKESSITEEEQRTLVNIVLSFIGYTDANSILDHFLEIVDGSRTRFEIIYEKLDDARIERYPVVNWFVDYQTNKKFFIYAFYEIWKNSKYNFYYLPNGVIGNGDGINDSAFWFSSPGDQYFPQFDPNGNLTGGNNPVLEVTFTEKTGDGIKFIPQKKLVGTDIRIDQVEFITETVVTEYSAGTYTTENNLGLFGQYHLYQPISLIGFEADHDLKIPSVEPIPAFLYYYAVDYDNIKDFDASMILLGEVVLEVGLFFAFGGASSLRHLHHLKHLTKLRLIKNNSSALASGYKALIWRGMDGAAEVTSATTSVISSFYNYQATTSNDPDIIETKKRLSNFFMALSITSVGAGLGSRHLCVKNADEVIKKVEDLTLQGKAHNLPTDVVNLLYDVRNSAIVNKALFDNFMTPGSLNSRLTGTNHISTIYATFDDATKEAFWRDFYINANDDPKSISFWNDMNKTEVNPYGGTIVNGARMEAWKDVPNRFKPFRKNIQYLDEVIKLSITDRKAYEHLAEFKNRPTSGKRSTFNKVTGGHKFNIVFDGSSDRIVADNGIEIIDPEFLHTLSGSSPSINIGTTSQKMIDYLNKTGADVYSKNPLLNGHFDHRKLLIKLEHQPTTTFPKGHSNFDSQFVLNGIYYKKKPRHMQINPSWSESDIIHEYAYATWNKKPVSETRSNRKHGEAVNRLHIKTEYEGVLLDGTKVEIHHENFFRYNEQSTFSNHYTFFKLIL